MATDLSGSGDRYRHLSLWWDAPFGPVEPRPPLAGNLDVDVAIVGAGFTGLWTAHSLALADRGLRVALVEREVAGFGASGRNGGWCSALFAASDARIERQYGLNAARAMRRAMIATVEEVARAAASEGIDCDFEKGGTVVLARNAAQAARARNELSQARNVGVSEVDLRWLDAEETRSMIGATDVLGSTYTPHCAALQPVRLARGLAEAVERRGVSVFEATTARGIEPGRSGRRPRIHTDRGTITADVVVRAVEGWTPQLAGERRTIAPLYSLMVATEPLGDEFWSEVHLEGRQTFSDHRHLIIYGQRTADGRLAFGGRGAPYHFASAVRPSFDRASGVHRALAETLVELFPALRGRHLTHRWGGPLGVPRDWFSSVGLDPVTGMAWAGGYVGDGVSTTNLAGRTLADLITRRPSELTELPWVGHQSPRWEPEPLRWLGVNAGLVTMGLADRAESRTGRPSRLARPLGRLLGG